MDLATAVGKPLNWTCQGKTYPVAERDLDFACAFQRWLEERELEGVRRHADALGGDYPQALDNWQKGVATGVYEWGSQFAWKSYTTPSGYKFAAALSLAGGGLDLTVAQELIDRAYEDDSPEGKAAWKELQAILKALNDPNRKRLLKQEAPAAQG